VHTLRNTPRRILLLVAIWLFLLGVGSWKVAQYATQPGAAAPVSTGWPRHSSLLFSNLKYNLLVFVHPECPCSEATIAELASLQPQLASSTKISVVFVRPAGYSSEIEKSSLWQLASTLKNTTLKIDENGEEALNFATKTSGQVLLYSATGQLQFRGGITAARGHRGENLGSLSIISLVSGHKAVAESTRVLGCSLVNPERKIAGQL